MLYKMVELEEGATLQFVGVHAVSWDYVNWGLPKYGFVEADEFMEEHKALQELLAVRELRQERDALRARVEELEERVRDLDHRLGVAMDDAGYI